MLEVVVIRNTPDEWQPVAAWQAASAARERRRAATVGVRVKVEGEEVVDHHERCDHCTGHRQVGQQNGQDLSIFAGGAKNGLRRYRRWR